MKKIILFVCLFFMCSTTIYAKDQDYKDQLDTLLKKEESTKDISSLSKELSELNQDLNKEMESLKKKENTYEKKKNSLCINIENIQEKIEKLSGIQVYMLYFQYGKDTEILEQYIECMNQFHQFQIELDSIQKKIEKNTSVQSEYESYIEKIQACQERLSYRFSSSEMNNKGTGNENSMIQGSEDLPVYGGYYSNQIENWQACLTAGNLSIDSYSDAWIFPIQNGSISAGTWAYASGDTHLGLDVACSLYSNVCAPANGIILYADAPVETDCGYLGNWVGWPAGGGNTVCMICAVQEQLYCVTFAHLSDEILVTAGQQVSQGDVVALSGNSGNSTGPHCHIEVFECNESLEEIVNYFIQGADFSFGNGFSEPATCSAYACRIRPESVWG